MTTAASRILAATADGETLAAAMLHPMPHIPAMSEITDKMLGCLRLSRLAILRGDLRTARLYLIRWALLRVSAT